MELFALLLLLLWNGNDEMKSSLRSFLSLYREHRDLFTALMKNPSASASTQSENATPTSANISPSSEQKNRPRDEVGNIQILQDYLERALQER